MINIILNNYFNAVFLRFIVVGVFNTLLNYIIFYACFSELGMHYAAAGIIGFFSGAISGYLFNRLWTFKSDVPFTDGMIKYFLVQCICVSAHLLTQTSVVWLFAIPKLYSQFFGIIVTTFLNFTLVSKLVYRKS